MADMKFIMLGISVLFCMIGGTMLGVGIWMAVDDDAQEALDLKPEINEDLYWTAVYFMIIIGTFVFLVSFLGMFASAAKNKGALYGFIGIVCFILIMELVLIIITGIFWDSLGDDLGTQDQWLHEVQVDYVDEYATDNISVKWNNMQIDSKCCGSRDYNDWDQSNFQAINKRQVPWTCCVMYSGGRANDTVVNYGKCMEDAASSTEILGRSDYLYTRGCYSAMKDFLEDHSIILIALTVVFAAIQVAGIVIAVMMLRD